MVILSTQRVQTHQGGKTLCDISLKKTAWRGPLDAAGCVSRHGLLVKCLSLSLRHRLPACGFDTLVSWREVAMGAGTLVCHEGLPRFQILLPTGQEGGGGLQLGFRL